MYPYYGQGRRFYWKDSLSLKPNRVMKKHRKTNKQTNEQTKNKTNQYEWDSQINTQSTVEYSHVKEKY